MSKLILLGAGAVGYVLGAKAGRERYEQISRSAQKIRTNPTVQQKMEEAKEAASSATEKVRKQSEGSTTTNSTSPTYASESF
jgi:hypothetical protein